MNNLQTIIAKPRWALLLILGITLCVFFPSLSNELQTGWDDQWQVVNHYTEDGFTWNNIVAIFTEPLRFQYSPIDQLMYTFLYSLAGYSPFAFHGASLLLHFVNIVLVFVLLTRVLLDCSLYNRGICSHITFWVTLIFAIHPMQVESVAWVSASKIPLYVTFFLLALFFWINYLRHSRISSLLCVFLCFVLSYGSKEQAVVFPLMALLMHVIYRKPLWYVSSCVSLSALFLLAAVLGFLCIFVISSFSEMPIGRNSNDYLWWQRVVFSVYAVVEYVMKWFAPFNLMHMYHYPMSSSDPMPTWMLLYPMCFAIGSTALAGQLKHPISRIGILIFFINIILVLHLFPIRRPSIVADRYMYLAGIGLSLMPVHYIVARFAHWKQSTQRRVLLAGVIYVLFLATYAHYRVARWHDTSTLKQEIIDARKQAGKEAES